MNINIKATNTHLTEAIRMSINEKLAPLDRFLRPEDQVYVELEEDTHHRNGLTSRVEINIQPHNYYAESHGNDFYEALDLLIPKIREQLSRSKGRKLSLRRRLGSLFKRFDS